MSLPKQVMITPHQLVPVVERELTGGNLGYFDCGTGEIGIESRQHEVGKHQILLHEIMHGAAEVMKQAKICRRQPSDEFIQEFSGCVFMMLACSGLWNGVSKDEALAWMDGIR